MKWPPNVRCSLPVPLLPIPRPNRPRSQKPSNLWREVALEWWRCWLCSRCRSMQVCSCRGTGAVSSSAWSPERKLPRGRTRPERSRLLRLCWKTFTVDWRRDSHYNLFSVMTLNAVSNQQQFSLINSLRPCFHGSSRLTETASQFTEVITRAHLHNQSSKARRVNKLFASWCITLITKVNIISLFDNHFITCFDMALSSPDRRSSTVSTSNRTNGARRISGLTSKGMKGPTSLKVVWMDSMVNRWTMFVIQKSWHFKINNCCHPQRNFNSHHSAGFERHLWLLLWRNSSLTPSLSETENY